MSESLFATREKSGITGASLVDWIQNLRVPCGNGENGVPLITGLDKVVFGTLSAAEAVTLFNIKPPQYLWYMISGGICDIIQFTMDFIMHFYVHDPSICWAVTFALSIIFRHTIHRYLVFGDYVGGYWNSLMRMYGGYSVIIVLSTAFNFFMTRLSNVSHYVAWITTLLWTGIVNYFILKKLWSFTGSKGGKPAPTGNSSVDEDVELAPLQNRVSSKGSLNSPGLRQSLNAV